MTLEQPEKTTKEDSEKFLAGDSTQIDDDLVEMVVEDSKTGKEYDLVDQSSDADKDDDDGLQTKHLVYIIIASVCVLFCIIYCCYIYTRQ